MKTSLSIIVILLASMASYSQIIKPTRYYLDSLKNRTTEQNSKYIRVVENYKNQEKLFLFTDYYLSGKVNMKAISTNKDTPRFEGPRIDYYENGNKKQESNYVSNKLSGIQTDWYENKVKKTEKELTWNPKTFDYNAKILQFWNPEGHQTVIDSNGHYEHSDEKIQENGELKNGEKQGVWEGKDLESNFSFKEIYNNGVFISGISTDENNNKHPYKVLTEKASPAKGIQDFYKYIAENYKTPNIQGLQGRIYITFVINKEGKLTKFKILRDLGYGTGQEAIHILQKAENWIPGKMRGMPYETLFSLPISIKSSGVSNSPDQEPTFESEMMRNTNPNW